MNINCIWSTADELRFLKDIQPKEISKLQFLKNYKEALCNRTQWDMLNKKKIMKEVNKSIKLLEEGERLWQD